MASASYDLIVHGGQVVDGTGNPWVRLDIGVRDGRIAALGNLADEPAERRIDASGRWVTPGFVDVHAHSDFGIIANREAQSQVRQGITTEVVGNCGFGAFPRRKETLNLLFDPPGVDGEWSSADEYFQVLGSEPTGDNIAPLLGLGTVRKLVMGDDSGRASPEQIELMRAEVDAAMRAGAFGVSTGLDYAPSSYADLDELVSMCEVVAEYGGVYASHLRGYTDTAVESVQEAITIGERSGASVQLSHMNVFGRRSWGKIDEIIALINDARARGVDVTADMMAYPTAGAWWAPRAILPASHYEWSADQTEQLARVRAYLRDPAERAVIRKAVEERRTMSKAGFHEELLIFSDWRDVYLAGTAKGSVSADRVGESFAAIAESTGAEPVDVFLDAIRDEGDDFSAVHIGISQDEADALMVQPWMMFGTDSIATSIDRWTEPYNTIQSHPRHYASYVRLLATFVRDRGLLTIEDAVRKMTSLGARRFRLAGRGIIDVGAWADLVVFDLDSLDEVASWRQPRRYPAGIDTVVVNGVPAVSDGDFTHELGGRALRLTPERTA
ncbi:D-aminoacylase [Phytoactinopolyspora alkaliphila]|uniref:D-aminoacylase n=1 Tax=Phytoactinopolyspora alkaliphila TaxID=1783498 RepID=A0A6N9YNJ2_9ACTN|nr:D-aminoacylase [Phytoactinopolyspora alkaliphila]NED96500.1 D-aminoacylase [Phytoactinopolyspora alkaliphila]